MLTTDSTAEPGMEPCRCHNEKPKRCADLHKVHAGSWESHEVSQLLAAARDDWTRTVLLFALHTGARMGEQRAVRWSDIDFEKGIITIRRSAPKWLVVEKSPKSNRHRRVDLTPELAEALEKIRHSRETVFCNSDGSKLRPGQFHGRSAATAAQEEGGTSSHQVARAAALVRVDPDVGRSAVAGGAVAARSFVDEDDRALRASRAGAKRRIHAPALHSLDAARLGPTLGPIRSESPRELKKLARNWPKPPRHSLSSLNHCDPSGIRTRVHALKGHCPRPS